MARCSPQKTKDKFTAAFQSGAFSPFPPRSNCLFSSLPFSSSLGLWPCCRKVMFVVVLTSRVSTCSVVGEEMSPSWFEPTPAVKKPSAVVRPVSHVPSFWGHCCPGVSRSVPADGGSSSPRSGSILPSLFSSSKHTSGGISGLSGQGLQCCTVSTGVTVTCASSRPRFSTSRLSMSNSSSLTLPCSIELLRLLTFCLGIEIAFFNSFTLHHKSAAYSSGVGGSERGPRNQLSSPSATRSKPFIFLQVASFSNVRRSLIFWRRWASTVSVTIASIRLRFLSFSDSTSTASISSSVYPFFITSVRSVIFTHVPRRSLSPFLASPFLLYSASSAPALMSLSSGRSCTRSRHSSCPPSGGSSPSAVLQILRPTSLSYIKRHFSHRVPGREGVFYSAKRVLGSWALTFGYGRTVHVWVDVGAGDAEVDVIYTSFIMSVQYIGYVVPYKDKVQHSVLHPAPSETCWFRGMSVGGSFRRV